MNLYELIIPLIDYGIYVYPIELHPENKSINKRPAKFLEHGYKDASNDKEVIKKWFENADADNTGVAINLEKSGLVCIDIDEHNPDKQLDAESIKQAIREDINNLISIYPSFNLNNAGYIEQSQNKGLHIFFKSLKGINKRNLTDNIELLTEQVIIAPTKDYKAIKGSLCQNMKVIPKQLAAKGKTFSKSKNMYLRKRPIGKELDSIFLKDNRERHDKLIDIARALWQNGVSIQAIQQIMTIANDNFNMPLSSNDLTDVFSFFMQLAREYGNMIANKFGNDINNIFIDTAQGMRHNDLISLVQSLMWAGVEIDTMEQFLILANNNLSSPLPDKELSNIFEWAIKKSIKIRK